MHTFYLPALSLGVHQLPEEEGVHCVRVLRLRAGDEVRLVNGRGLCGFGTIVANGRKDVQVEVSSLGEEELTPGRMTWIGVSPTKQMERMEWFVEKAVEVGLGRVSFLRTAHSERMVFRGDRLRRITVAAAKQSQTAWFPSVDDAMISFEDFFELASPASYVRLIAHPGEGVSQGIFSLLAGEQRPLCLLVGPEGGFREDEVRRAISAGFSPVSLGEHRLRTETAALVGCVAGANRFTG